MKSEIRNPKSERRPKTEIRISIEPLRHGVPFTIENDIAIRVSNFFRISDFGFRI